MKKILKATAGLIICIIVLTSVMIVNTSAAGTIIAFSKKSLTVGEAVTVTVSLDAGEAMYATGCVINYDNNVLSYTSGNAVGGAGSVQIAEAPSGETKVSYSLTFTAIAAGSCTISVADCKYEVLGANGAESRGLSGASATLTVKDAALSANANLSALSLSTGTLSPRFSASRTSYTVAVKNSVTECKIYATAADSGAKVEVSGESALKIGKNVRTVTVTAPSGAQKVYTITINRSETDEEISSEETSTDTEVNMLETTIEGVTHTVATDISAVTMFKGFTATTAQFNTQDVAVATDANGVYKLYYLKAADSEVLVPYTFDEENQLFTKLAYFIQGENAYIYTDIPEDKTVGSDFYKTTATINGNEVSCYAANSATANDFYYLYCYADGRYGFYRYDNRENVMQRYPELELVDVEELTKEPQKDTLLTRFVSLTANAKIIVISLLFVIIFVVALIVLLIIKYAKRNDNDLYETEDIQEDMSFDSVSYGNFSLDVYKDPQDSQESETIDESDEIDEADDIDDVDEIEEPDEDIAEETEN